MKNKVRFKIIINSSITKIILILLIILSLFLAIILPSILLRSPRGSVTVYNRDSASGTRQAFAEKVLDKKDFIPGFNVREVANNDAMIRAVTKSPDSIGYVSSGTVAEFDVDGNTVISKENEDIISFVSFESEDGIVSPTFETISDGTYLPSRNFNMFLRVESGTPESEITLYDWMIGPDDQIPMLQDKMQSLESDLLMSYLFMNWSLHSYGAQECIDANGEIPPKDDVDALWTKDEEKEILNNYISYTGLNNTTETTIEIVGSTSASSILKEMSKLFEEIMLNDYGLVVKVILSTNGSGDAFKESIPGTSNPYIGIQSRSPNSSELESWGWDEDDVNLKSVYDRFAIDAILIIYNLETNDPENSFDFLEDNLYTNSEKMLYLYTTNDPVLYSEIFLTMEGGSND